MFVPKAGNLKNDIKVLSEKGTVLVIEVIRDA